jgi:uncharacterized membrane protein (DUF2068 family)
MTENDTLDGQIASRQRVPSTLAVFAKVLIIFLAGDLSEFLFHQHPAAAYAAGCAIGALLQALVPPRGGWKLTAWVTFIAVVGGASRYFLKS